MSEALKPNEYRCAHCGEVYEKGWTEAEALAESAENFGPIASDDVAVVCDDCYKKMVAAIPPKEWVKNQMA